MTYDRYDTRNDPREERSRWRGERFEGRGRDLERDRNWRDRDERGFFERAGDEIASWFGDDDEADRRTREDRTRLDRERGRDEDRGRFFGRDRDDDRFRSSEHGYRPMTGDYSRSEGFFAASGAPRGRFDRDFDDRSGFGRSHSPYERDEDRRTRFESGRGREVDPHYHSWRERHLSELDRDYDEYRRENQSRFEDDFTGWRERRMQKRGLLGQIREHMEVVGSDDGHVGTVDRVAGDRVILTRSDPESGGAHHSLSCSEIERIEGDRVILGCAADQAKLQWRDESRSRALFEREDQGEMGPRVLDRSFEGTYR